MSASVLNSPVLELNKSWQAIGICTLKDAICKLLATNDDGSPKARIIDPVSFTVFTWDDWSKLELELDDKTIASASMVFKVPSIILHTDYDKMPKPRNHFSRRSLFKRDKYTCQYCSKKPAVSELNIDHVLPRAQGGKTTWENCVVSCCECNAYKRDRTPEQAGMKLLSVPTKPKNKPIFIKNCHHSYIKSWSAFVSEAYWNVELENENA